MSWRSGVSGAEADYRISSQLLMLHLKGTLVLETINGDWSFVLWFLHFVCQSNNLRKKELAMCSSHQQELLKVTRRAFFSLLAENSCLIIHRFHSQKAVTRRWKCKLMIHRDNGAFTPQRKGEKMIDTNSFTLLFLFSCCASRSCCWVIDREEAADKKCLCIIDSNVFFSFSRSFALNLSKGFFSDAVSTASAAVCFWSAKRRRRACWFSFIIIGALSSQTRKKTSITNTGLTVWTNINLSDHSARSARPGRVHASNLGAFDVTLFVSLAPSWLSSALSRFRIVLSWDVAMTPIWNLFSAAS